MKIPERIETTDVRAYEDIYTVMVNDEPLLTPKGHPVSVRSWELANAIADDLVEEGVLDLQRVTLYSLYATERDFIQGRIEGAMGVILQRLPADFVLHPDADPVLAAKQFSAWAIPLGFLRDVGAEVPIAKPLHEAHIPWELSEGLRVQLLGMNSAQLSVIVNAVMSFGSVSLGMLLAQRAIELDQAVSALTVTATYTAQHVRRGGDDPEIFVTETRQTVRRMLQYVRLNC